MFGSKDLRNLIVPLFLEQLLTILVGISDTFVISFVGEAAVSGVSLVNSFNTIFIFLFTALASGGAVIVSQYIGSRKRERAGEAASQLLMISTVFSAAIAVLLLLFGGPVRGGCVRPGRGGRDGGLCRLSADFRVFLSGAGRL